MTNLEHDILNFELFQISVFLDELNEMLKKDMVALIKLKHKKYRAKRGSGALGQRQVRMRQAMETQLRNRGSRVGNPAYPFSPKQWYLLN